MAEVRKLQSDGAGSLQDNMHHCTQRTQLLFLHWFPVTLVLAGHVERHVAVLVMPNGLTVVWEINRANDRKSHKALRGERVGTLTPKAKCLEETVFPQASRNYFRQRIMAGQEAPFVPVQPERAAFLGSPPFSFTRTARKKLKETPKQHSCQNCFKRWITVI